MTKETLLYKRPFDENPYLAELSTKVVSCTPCKEGYAAVFEQTIFFPRGGGQPCDGGFINDMEVIDVYDENGDILHILPKPLEAGSEAVLKINTVRRKAHMQHHLGQHILSAFMTKLFHDDTCAAHIDDKGGQIEVPRPLTPDEILTLEIETNKLLANNNRVITEYYTPEEARTFDVRGKITPHELIRLVEIEGFDINACGGTHCRTVGEIEDIVITGTKNVRGVFRIYFKAGDAAKAERLERTKYLIAMQSALGAENPQEGMTAAADTVSALSAFEEQNKALRERLTESDTEALLAKAEIINEKPFIFKVVHTDDSKHFKSIGDTLVNHHKATVVLALASEENISLIFMRPKGGKTPDFGGRLRALTSQFGGKGGGSPVMAQGMIPYSEEAISQIENTAKEIKEEII